jgi:phosphoribosylpyrophosphate synthetase
VKLVEALHAMGPQSINLTVTHGMFNKDAITKLIKLHDEGKFEYIYVTNTVCREHYPAFVKVIDVAPIFADTIKKIFM